MNYVRKKIQFISTIYYSHSRKKQFNRKNHREMQRNLYRKIESDDQIE